MSKTDYATLAIVTVCLVALAFLIYKMVNLNQESAKSEDQLEQFISADTLSAQENYPAEEFPETENMETAEALDEADISPVDEYRPESLAANVNDAGDFMVLAGSFRQRMNAELLEKRLKQQGYPKARVELFNRGTFAVVLVDRFEQLAEANALVSTLAAQGVEARVQKKRN
jgi:cell division septation protein DedD